MSLRVSTYRQKLLDSVGFRYLFFLIYPFGSFLYNIKDFSVKQYRLILLSFFVLYGFTYIPIPKSDSDTYQQIFIEYSKYTFADYINEIKNTYSGLSRNPDVYAPTVLFITSRLTENPQYYFAVVAAIYFFVFLKMLQILWSLKADEKNSTYLFYFLGMVFILNLSAGINGLRFPLAFMIFSLGSLLLLLTNRPVYLLLALSAGLVHFSLWLSGALLVLYYFILQGRSIYFYYGLLLIAVFTYGLFSEFLFQNIGSFGEGVQEKFQGYSREGYKMLREEHTQKWNWYVLYNMYATFYFLIGAIILTRIKIFNIAKNVLANRMYVFAILLFIQGLLTGNVLDSISNRYVILFKLFGLIYLFYTSMLNKGNRIIRFLTWCYLPIVVLSVLVSLRADSFTVSPYLFIGNLFLILFVREDIPLPELL